MRFSSYNWPAQGKRGWVIGPFFGRMLYVEIRNWKGRR